MYRLTLVKQWNTDELEAYASLVSKGRPDFIEIKVCIFDNFHIDVIWISIQISIPITGCDILWGV